VDEAGSRRRRRSRGSKAPTRHWSIAAPERATADETILELLERAAEAHGFRGDVWSCERVAKVIRKEFGVSYHPAHVSRLLKALRHAACTSRSAGRIKGRRRPSSTTAKKRGGLPSKKGAKGRHNHSVCRSVGLLCVGYGGSHFLRPGGEEAHSKGKPHTRRSPLKAISAITLEKASST
jgi:hypothetical protein